MGRAPLLSVRTARPRAVHTARLRSAGTASPTPPATAPARRRSNELAPRAPVRPRLSALTPFPRVPPRLHGPRDRQAARSCPASCGCRARSRRKRGNARQRFRPTSRDWCKTSPCCGASRSSTFLPPTARLRVSACGSNSRSVACQQQRAQTKYCLISLVKPYSCMHMLMLHAHAHAMLYYMFEPHCTCTCLCSDTPLASCHV